MQYLEFKFDITPYKPGTELLIAELSDYGFDGFRENHDHLLAYIPKEDFNEKTFSDLYILRSEDFKVKFSKKIMEDQNWNEVWESNFKPVEINGLCILRAPFHPAPEKDIEYDIVVEPKMSFGTGHHATTFLMMEELLKMEKKIKNKEVLDMGSGTGVLGILASKMGASSVTAIDNDHWAFTNAVENFELNNVENGEVFEGDASMLNDKRFNIILANINRNILVEDIPVYNKFLEKNGHLLLSGFLKQDEGIIAKVAEENDLTVLHSREKDNWMMMHCRK